MVPLSPLFVLLTQNKVKLWYGSVFCALMHKTNLDTRSRTKQKLNYTDIHGPNTTCKFPCIKVISEGLKFKGGGGGMPPDPPSMWCVAHPPKSSTFPPPPPPPIMNLHRGGIFKYVSILLHGSYTCHSFSR